MGLTSLESKISVITTNEPRIGLVAVTNESQWGHLSFVIELKDSSIIVTEANYFRGYITTREIDKEKVIGYI